MLEMPVLETERLVIRPFEMDDLEAIHRILDVELAHADFGNAGAMSLPARREWLEWTAASYKQLALLFQPPYGDRAVALKNGAAGDAASGAIIGAVGFVPSFAPFGQLPSFGRESERFSAELGLYYAISPRCQRRGFATEAARAMVAYAFKTLRVGRVVATTAYQNEASVGVMRKLGMRIEANPYPDPPWFQIAGILDNDSP